MADLTFILTTAGFNALVNPANTGTSAITVDRIGVSAVVLPGSPESNIGLTQLPNELKRVATFGGGIVGDNTIHVTIRDESPDIYQLRTFGLYSAAGVLLAFYTQPLPIMEKAASSMLLLSADLQFTTPIAAELVFGDTNFINPPATTSQQGVVELATAPETAEGTDATRAVTPFGLKSLLTALLAGFSTTGHTHAAGDIVSGVLNVARIPDLAQSKITGLVDALSGKAASVHSHVMADITGLVAALGLKLAIADFTWQNLVGKPNVAINGLDASFAALTSGGAAVWTSSNFDPASRAAAVHSHAAGDVTSGVFAVGRIPDLAQSKITGLAAALSEKAAAVHSHDWAQITGKPYFPFFSQAATSGQMRVDDTAGGRRVHVYGDPDGYGFLVPTSGGGWSLRITAASLYFTASGTERTVWHSGNFDPTTKAAAIHSHDWAQITGKPDFTAATAAQFRANSSSQQLTPTTVWSAAALVGAAQAATIAIDMASGLNFSTTMTGNRTLGAPTNAKPGQSGVIQIIQDATGGRTLAFNAAWKFEGGTLPTLSTAANARDVLVFTVIAANEVVASLIKDVR